MIAGIPVGMMLPMMRAKGIIDADGATMARDLFAHLTAEDRAYVGGIVAAFAREWESLIAPASALEPCV